MATFSLEKSVTKILKNSKTPLKARQIARTIRETSGVTVQRRDVNSILYNELENKVEKNENFEWKLL